MVNKFLELLDFCVMIISELNGSVILLKWWCNKINLQLNFKLFKIILTSYYAHEIYKSAIPHKSLNQLLLTVKTMQTIHIYLNAINY